MPDIKQRAKCNWRVRFTKKFSDNVVPGSVANDLFIGKDDGAKLMKFIQSEIDIAVSDERNRMLAEALEKTANITDIDKLKEDKLSAEELNIK